MRSAFKIILIWVGLFTVSLSAQVRDSIVYKKPHEVGISLDVLQKAEKGLQGANPDCASYKENLRREISRYTSQFIHDKRILEERRFGRFDPGALDRNTVRLINLFRKSQYARVQFLGESPLMYRLHRALGACYEREKDTYRALSEYGMTLRYSGLEQPWTDFKAREAKAKAKGVNPEIIEARAIKGREERYRLIFKGFAGSDRIAEEKDADFKAAGIRFRKALKEYDQVKILERAAERTIDVMIARKARRLAADPAAAQKRYEGLKKKREALFAELEGIRLKEYRRYLKQKQGRDGDLAYRMALLIKELETKNKRLSRILNRSSFYRGSGGKQEQEKTRLNKFIGYGIFLELANKLDPDNTLYLSLLAEEYRNGRYNRRAIAFEERYIELTQKEKPLPAEKPAHDKNLAEHFQKLGGLYTDIRNFSRAAQAYKNVRSYEKNPVRLRQVELHLADIYFFHTGNFPDSRDLYQKYIIETGALSTGALGYRQKTEFHMVRYRVFRNLASIQRRLRRTEWERTALGRAQAEFKLIEDSFIDFKSQEKVLQGKILKIKKDLLYQEDAGKQLTYFTLLNRELPDLKERTGYLRTHLNALNLPALLERSAFLALRERKFNRALNVYREIIRRGTGEQSTRARSNIQLINLTLSDGILRKPVLPPDFER